MGYSPPNYGKAVLKKFGLTEEQLLGQGSGSRVFEVDATNILRIYRPETSIEYVDSLMKFYQTSDSSKTSFDLPKIFDFGTHDGHLFSVENKLDNNLEQAISFLKGEQRITALEEFTQASGAIKDIEVIDKTFYGEIIGAEPLQKNSWPEYLLCRVEKSLQTSYKHFLEDVPNFKNILNSWQEQVSELPDPERYLVHGDYFPGNVIIDVNGRLNTIIDFSNRSLIGDWRIDPIIAFSQAELGGLSKQEAEMIKSQADDLYKLSPEIIDLYHTYYCLLLSERMHEDPVRLYKNWCVKYLIDKST